MAILNMESPIYMSYGAEDIKDQNARVERIQQLYKQDGRDDPKHPWHGCYTGLHQAANAKA